MRREVRVQIPVRVDFHNANTVHISFAEVDTSSLPRGQLYEPKNFQIHLTITSDRVVTDTDILEHRHKKNIGNLLLRFTRLY